MLFMAAPDFPQPRLDTPADKSERLRAAAAIITDAHPGLRAEDTLFWRPLAEMFTAAADNIDTLTPEHLAALPRTQQILTDMATGYLLSPQLDGR
jgi:hypothetical protein